MLGFKHMWIGYDWIGWSLGFNLIGHPQDVLENSGTSANGRRSKDHSATVACAKNVPPCNLVVATGTELKRCFVLVRTSRVSYVLKLKRRWVEDPKLGQSGWTWQPRQPTGQGDHRCDDRGQKPASFWGASQAIPEHSDAPWYVWMGQDMSR